MNAMNNAMLYVRHAELLRDKVPSFQTYPFHLPQCATSIVWSFRSRLLFW